jgi:hypothetical protein
MVIFEAKDPRGFVVECTDSCWNQHINRHPDIKGFEHEAQRAIEEPTLGYIFQSNSMQNRHIYYKKIAGRRAEIKIVVEFNGSNSGIVKSVCFVSNRPKGEVIIWPK